jgi:CheB methylesterase
MSLSIVGIGASAGGLESFSELLARVPPDTGMACVCVQHHDPGHASRLVEILSKRARFPVEQAREDRSGWTNPIATRSGYTFNVGIMKLLPAVKLLSIYQLPGGAHRHPRSVLGRQIAEDHILGGYLLQRLADHRHPKPRRDKGERASGMEQQKAKRGHFAPIGSNGFWIRGRRARLFRSATTGNPRHDCRLRGSIRADSGCELAPGCAPLLRLVSGSERSRSAALRCEHGWLSRRVASGPRKPKFGRRIHPRIPLVARRNDASRSGTAANPTSECN